MIINDTPDYRAACKQAGFDPDAHDAKMGQLVPLWDVPLTPLEIERVDNGEIVDGMPRLTLEECRAEDAERIARGETHDRYGNRYFTPDEAKDFFGE